MTVAAGRRIGLAGVDPDSRDTVTPASGGIIGKLTPAVSLAAATGDLRAPTL